MYSYVGLCMVTYVYVWLCRVMYGYVGLFITRNMRISFRKAHL